MLFLRAIKKNLYFFAIAMVLLIVSTRIWEPMPLIVPLPNSGFVDFSEILIPFLLVLPVSFLLYDTFEIELGLVCGVKTSRMMSCKFWAVFLSTIVPSALIIAMYQYTEYIRINQEKIRIPIHIPENFKLYLLISSFVTTLFFASFLLFMRVLTRNCYAPVGLGILVYSIASSFNFNIHSGYLDIRQCLFDPFLSNYLLGDKVLTEYYQVGPLWTYNRLLFFGLTVIMLVVTYILLRREKLHQGFSD